ncbi:MAG: hypothetical protein PHS30_04090 [Bacteroidales bacterium]|nr:hypothetical protein [Bacteroidales bacterium]
MEAKKRIVVVVNKYWECDPVCSVLTNRYIKDQCGIDLNFEQTFKNSHDPSYGPVKVPLAEKTEPRMYFETTSRIIEIWCISDLLSNSPDKLQSSSEEKMRLLPIIFNYLNNGKSLEIELIIAVGTASSGPSVGINPFFDTDNINGSVVIGSKVFMHNGWDKDSASNYQCSDWGTILESGTNNVIEQLQGTDFSLYEQLLLSPPTNPSPLRQHIYVDEKYVALGDVNVTDYTKYTQKDQETGDDFFAKYPDNLDGVSLETTHCLIYQAAKNHNGSQNPPFIFVSGITDRYTMFSSDVNPKVYGQNVSCAHNAGVAVAYILSQLIN